MRVVFVELLNLTEIKFICIYSNSLKLNSLTFSTSEAGV